jgi:hypothetical protein
MLLEALARHHHGMRARPHTVRAGGVRRVILFLGTEDTRLATFLTKHRRARVVN